MAERSGSIIIVVAALAAAAGLARVAGAQQPTDRPATKPADPVARQFTAEVRAADVSDVLGRLSDSLDVSMDAEPGISTHRVTLRAAKTNVSSFQQALAALYHTGWRRTGDREQAHYRLANDSQNEAAADRLRIQRRAIFLSRLIETSDQLRRGRGESAAAAIRGAVERRMPELPPESTDEITPEYLSQTLLVAPLRNGLSNALARTGSAWLPFYNLSAANQQLFAGFLVGQYQVNPAPTSATDPVNAVLQQGDSSAPLVLNSPQARLEYRLLYGDRWTGTIFAARVGAGDTWGQAMLPSSLYDVPDYAALYPEAAAPPVGRELYSRTNLQIDTGAATWDQALAAIARLAKLNVISNSYPRPDLFRPAGKSPVLQGTTLGELLEKVTRYYGYAWWKEGEWYLFRSRNWADEERVSAPQSLLQSMGKSIAGGGHLSGDNLVALSGLTDEQLLTLHLFGKAAGRVTAPVDSFNYNEIQVARAALLLLGRSPADQLALVREGGIAYSRMNAAQRFIFASLASDRNIPLYPYEQARWAFRMTDQFRHEKLSAGNAEVGSLTFTFDYASGGSRTTDLAVRVPATGAARKAPDAPEGAG